MDKAYEAKKVEDKIYKSWEDSGFFNPDNLPEDRKEPFTISMPPPNATGTLHIGHGMFLTVQDMMIRYQRMQGKKALWLPGTDHAAIATQTKVEKILLKEENKTRHDLGREKFLARVEDYIKGSQDTIRNQVRKMGSSCDWSREKYTLDEDLSLAVRTQFKNMYEDGLIYRGDRIVNWCPRCHSTLADDEVEHEDQTAKLYYFKYTKDFPITIATTRPETKIGDTAVAVNPKDKRYKDLVGKTFEVDFVGVPLKIKIIADRSIDMEFGTGALGVTPAHAQADWQMAEEQDLEIIKVINEDGKIHDGFGEFSGLSVKDARKKVVEKLQQAGLIEKEEEIANSLSICYRCGDTVEPLPSLQWFIDVNKKFKIKDSKIKGIRSGQETTLKELMKQVVEQEQINILPDRFNKIYFHWIENLRDWCISRQIWFGHQVPVWYRGDETYVGVKAPDGEGWTQDTDTLDTWFSAGLWTFSTLGWPKETVDLKTFHPTSVMETGYDLIFFWVARMILMTTYALGDVPFRTVYMHGLVRDEQGRKMSKSLGNIIDPLDVIKEYGTDALRLSYLIGIAPGQDSKLYDEKFVGARNFVNKLWNISRYILESAKSQISNPKSLKPETLADQWILSRLNSTIEEVTKQLDNFDFSAAGEILRSFTWDDLADWYLEITKVPNPKSQKDEILPYILSEVLKLWHPFIPFVTEEIWSKFNDDMLMVASWPEANKKLIDKKTEQDFGLAKDVIIAVRNLRAENKVEPAKKVKLVINAGKQEELIKEQLEIIKTLVRADEIDLAKAKPEQAAVSVVGGVEVYLPLAGLIDMDKEKERLNKEIAETEKYYDSLDKKLSNEEFTAKAPEQVVATEKQKLAEAGEKLEKLKEQLKSIS